MSRAIRYAFSTFASLVTILVILLVFATWKMSLRPMASNEYTPYIETVFSYLVPDAHAKIEKSTLTWDNQRHILALTCEQAKLLDENEAAFVYFPKVHLSLGVWGLLRGHIIPLELKADDAQFWLSRQSNGGWSAGGVSPDQTNETSASSGMDVLALLQDVGDELSNRYLSHDISIKQATFYVNDRAVRRNWKLTAQEISLSHEGSVAKGKAKIEFTQADKTSYLSANYHYDRKSAYHMVRLSFEDIKLSTLAPHHPGFASLALLDVPLSGSVSFGIDRDLNFASSRTEIEGKSGFLRDENIWPAPLPVNDLKISASYHKRKARLTLENFSLDLGDVKLKASGRAGVPVKTYMIWEEPKLDEGFVFKAALENLPMSRFAEIWPIMAVPNARAWMLEHMSKGSFPEAKVTLKGKIDWKDFAKSELLSVQGTAQARAMDVSYMPGMPPVLNVDGDGTFDLDHMDVKILKGTTDDVSIKPFTLSMTDFNEETQYISIPLHIDGPAPSVLKILDSDPLHYAQKVGLNPDDVNGKVDGVLTLRMPMLNDLLLDDIEYGAKAKFSDFASENLVPDIAITQGNLDFDLGRDSFKLDGPLQLNGAPFILAWESLFAPKEGQAEHKAKISSALKEDEWSSLLPKGLLWTEKAAPVTIHYEGFRGGLTKLTGQISLDSTALRSAYLSWDKKEGEKGKITFSLYKEKGLPTNIDDIKISGDGVDVQGNVILDAKTGDIHELIFKPYKIGRSDAEVTYKNPVDTSKPVFLDVRGTSLDISGLNGLQKEEVKEEAKAESAEQEQLREASYSLTVENLYAGETGFMYDVVFRGQRDKQGWKELLFDARANKETPVFVVLKTQDDHLYFKAETEDFGAALSGMGISEKVKGGKLWAEGKSSAKEPRVIRGTAKIDSFSVSDLPVLARLMNAVSPLGFVDLLTGDASFDHLRGLFKWKGSEIEVNKLRVAGSTFGINLDGRVNIDSNEANLSGTLVPFSFVNSIIGSIPLIGDVITGGDGQGVIAAAFKLTGSLSDPKISVNPVSLLTPGFLRNLFFPGEDVEDIEKKRKKIEKEEKKTEAVQKEPVKQKPSKK